jgi:hypothetical protein
MAERIWVWFTLYPSNGPSSMDMLPLADFIPIYAAARNDDRYIIQDGRECGSASIRVYDRSGRLVMDAETL